MTIAAKVTVATLGAGGISLMGCYVGGVFNGDIEWQSLIKDSPTTAYGDNTIGKEYGRYLTGLNEINKEWWEESFKKYTQDKNESADKLSTHFSVSKNITSAYSTEADNTTALNKVCETAYRKTISDVTFENANNPTEDNGKLAANILKYCSPLGRVPSIITNSTDTGKIGHKGQDKKLVNATENNSFWQAQNEWFKDQGTSAIDNYFKQFFEEVGGAKALKTNENIKKICEEAYTKEIAASDSDITNEKPKIDDVAKYCSFKKLT